MKANKIQRCSRCGAWPYRTLIHECSIHVVKREEKEHKLYAIDDVHAVERVSEYLDKEIFCKVGNKEYVSEKVGDSKYSAFLIFDGDNSVKNRLRCEVV